MNNVPEYADVLKAYKRIIPYIHRTPVLTSTAINRITGAELFFKCENFQKTGAFKFRGATNAVLSLSEEEAARGVATHSSGNHAAALALTAGMRGIKAHIVMPETSPGVKIAAVKGYGAEITFCKPTLEARESTLKKIVNETGAIFIHPYNNPQVIAGQGTAALELLGEVPGLGIVMAPVGGGGLLSGTATTVKGSHPGIKIIAAEPAGADDAYRSFKSGTLVPSVNPKTICDGLLTSLGDLTFNIIMRRVDDIVTVSEEAIFMATCLVMERMKIVIEPSAAVPLGAILENKLNAEGKRIGIILSGGNVDVGKLQGNK
ncbi:MAG: pyridoxal-phosphate dependent enzyme [Bacteroidetes bacterium]|nr:pyridoxal-phosphate dependent enzyme [Bacteroidota bacterium]